MLPLSFPNYSTWEFIPSSSKPSIFNLPGPNCPLAPSQTPVLHSPPSQLSLHSVLCRHCLMSRTPWELWVKPPGSFAGPPTPLPSLCLLCRKCPGICPDAMNTLQQLEDTKASPHRSFFHWLCRGSEHELSDSHSNQPFQPQPRKDYLH